jgi:hypothetical protein
MFFFSELGACTKDTILDTHCGTFLKRWEITAATSSEYLVQFHSDGSINKNGFTLQYFLGNPVKSMRHHNM